MMKYRGRNATACQDCHRQKVKCSGEQPCQRCATRRKTCVYPTQEPIVHVPQSYLEHLDQTLNELTNTIRSYGVNAGLTSAVSPPSRYTDPGLHINLQQTHTAADSLVGNSTAEAFIHKLRESVSSAGAHAQPLEFEIFTDESTHLSSNGPLQRHSSTKVDTYFSERVVRFPPYPHAKLLLDRAEEEFGDYHTFLRKTFFNRFHATYNGLKSETGDRAWLCRLSFVLALAESNTTTQRPIHLGLDGIATGIPPEDSFASMEGSNQILSAGVELFEQGVKLLNMAHEEPSIGDVEALNLASHCCYILNRRKSAYAYAGQSIRTAHCLGLDQPVPTGSINNVEREHRKRVWWTAFCVDRAISTELGLRPAYVGVGEGLDYPDSGDLTAEEQEEFFDADLLTAQIKLCEIKTSVVDTVSRLKSKDISGPYEIVGQCLQTLDRCGREMPERIFSSGGSTAESRICSSIALRYHQCYILLLRPILLYQFSFMLRNESVTVLSDELCTVNNICLHAARSNARIMLDVAQSGKLVTYGYWDSAHLFSCLIVLAIASPMFQKQPNTFQGTADDSMRDANTYQHARQVLVYMAKTGNLASKYHLSMLEDVEKDGTVLSAMANQGSYDGNAVPATSEVNVREIELGFEDWVRLTALRNATSNISDF